MGKKLNALLDGEPAPMEIDMLRKGGRGKGKDKSKDQGSKAEAKVRTKARKGPIMERKASQCAGPKQLFVLWQARTLEA